VAIRPSRRRALWVGLALCEAAWCVWLATVGVRTPEPYTLPVAAAGLAIGWRVDRNRPDTRSWLCYGPGLALLLLPSLVAVWSGPGWQNIGWQDAGWIRPSLLGLVAVAVAVVGARQRLQAPLLLGLAVAVLDAGRELAPAVRSLVGLLPGWVPIAILGAALLWAGATYEARLRNLGSLRRSLAAMR
jgi:hypothetical protein